MGPDIPDTERFRWDDYWGGFWCELAERGGTVDWQNSWVDCEPPEGGPPYRISLIRLHRGDLLARLRKEGLLPLEPAPEVETAPLASVEPTEPTPGVKSLSALSAPEEPVPVMAAKLWLAQARIKEPRRPGERISDYARRLEPGMRAALGDKTWTWRTIRRRFYDKP